MGEIISLVARKGGVGKTTLAANLAAELASDGAEVRLIDADPQQSLSIWASMGSGFLCSRVTAVAPNDEAVFRNLVSRLEDQTDILIVDTPPGFTEPALFAAKASDLVLVPCGASPLDLAAGRDAVSLCRQIRQHRGNGEPAIGLVPSRYLQNSGLGRDLTAALEHLGERTLPGITQRVALAEAAISGLTIREFAPNSPAYREIKALAKAVRSYLSEKRNQTTQAQIVGIR